MNRWGTVVIAVAVAGGCVGQNCIWPPPPQSSCAGGSKPSLGVPVAPASGKYTAVIEAKAEYLAAVLQNIAAQKFAPDHCRPGGGPVVYPDAGIAGAVSNCVGVDVTNVRLTQEDRADGRANLIWATFKVFVFGDHMQHVYLPDRTYTARVRLIPYLINSATVKDPAQRHALLQCGNCEEGVIVDADFDALLGGPHAGPNDPIGCPGLPGFDGGTRGFDYIDGQVLAQIQSLCADETSTRLRVPLDMVSQFLAAATVTPSCTDCADGGAPAKTAVSGVDIGSDGDLQIAIATDVSVCFGGSCYKPAPFAAGAMIRAANDADWGVGVDVALLRLLAERYGDSAIACYSGWYGGFHLDKISFDFVQDIGSAAGTMSFAVDAHLNPVICPQVPIHLSAVTHPQVCVSKSCSKHVGSVALYLDTPSVSYGNFGDFLCIGAVGVGVIGLGALIGSFVGVTAAIIGGLVGLVVDVGAVLTGLHYLHNALDSAAGWKVLALDLAKDLGPLGNLYPSGFQLTKTLYIAGRSDLVAHTEPDGCYQTRPDLARFPRCAGGCAGGNDGIGGTCPGPSNCNSKSTCVHGQCACNGSGCVPNCIGRCGDDGCGGTCACPSGSHCVNGGCQCGDCHPQCTDKCGNAPDGCGGTCNGCDAGKTCSGQSCVACTPVCGVCGPPTNGCGGECPDTCAAQNKQCDLTTQTCVTPTHICVPSCEGKACGDDDGCHGACDGPCGGGQVCQQGQCACPPRVPFWCECNDRCVGNATICQRACKL